MFRSIKFYGFSRNSWWKSENFTSPREAPGEGRRRVPNRKENSNQGIEPPKKQINPIKKFMMDFFKIEEIDYEKFRKEDKWAIHPTKKK